VENRGEVQHELNVPDGSRDRSFVPNVADAALDARGKKTFDLMTREGAHPQPRFQHVRHNRRSDGSARSGYENTRGVRTH
jgi:hypothetical protein